MIFSLSDHIEQIKAGTKTQTRRPSNRYIVGKEYAIQPGRGQPAIKDGKILITNKKIETKPFDKVSIWDASAEGKYTPEDYEELYEKMYPNWVERYVYLFKYVPNSSRSATE